MTDFTKTFQDILDRLASPKKRKYKLRKSIDTNEKHNGTNNKQKLFRPHCLVNKKRKVMGSQKKRIRFDSTVAFNEWDC